MSGTRSVGLLLHFREAGRDGADAIVRERAAHHGLDVWSCDGDPSAALLEHSETTALLVTVGGDGTFMLGARLAAPLGIPVLGVNRGQLGFLTDVDLDGLAGALDDFVAGRHRIQRRSLLEVSAVPPAGQSGSFSALALNEVAVKSVGLNLARLRVDADADLLGEFDADGVIVATATGSTAYALSAGGPPVDPRVRALVVVPLAPHAVITRAVVLPEAVTTTMTVVWGRTFVAVDGHSGSPLVEGSRVVIRPGPELHVVQLASSPTFLRRLREKVRFGMPLKETRDGHRGPAGGTAGEEVVEGAPGREAAHPGERG